MSQKCEAFVETGNFRDFSDGIVKELSIYIMLVPETLYKELSTFSTGRDPEVDTPDVKTLFIHYKFFEKL